MCDCDYDVDDDDDNDDDLVSQRKLAQGTLKVTRSQERTTISKTCAIFTTAYQEFP